MAQLVWDEVGKRTFETGVDHGVLYFPDDTGAYKGGVVWNGLTSVSESPSGGEASPQYADNIKYLNLYSAEDFGATIEAFTYPVEFEKCDGSAEIAAGVLATQQSRATFGFSYRTLIGNDVKGTDHGYKLHLVYGCKASPSEKSRSTVNESPEAIAFSWTVTTTPVPVNQEGFKPTAHLVIDSTRVDKANLKKIEDKLYGVSGDAVMPLPDEILTLLGAAGGAKPGQ